MKKIAIGFVLGSSLTAALAFAALPSTYQVTGNVTEVSDDTVTVLKGKEKFEIAKNADTKMEGGDTVKTGDKVTVTYRMTAAKIEIKPAGAKK